jgi:predicted O-methyltransferase YrrM
MTLSQNSTSSPVTNLIYSTAKALGLVRIVESILKYMPENIQDWVGQIKTQRFLSKHNIDDFIILPTEDLKQKQREALRFLCEKLGPENVGDYLEFGVYSGTSLSCMFHVLNEFNLRHVRLFGFDSFEGMPQSSAVEDEGTWYPGQFKFDINFTKAILTHRGIDWKRVFLTKGWFCDTLKPEFVQKHQIKRASVIMVDCDIYSSTKEVLQFCKPLITAPTVIFFDDWNSNELADKNLGEKLAFDEFLQENPQYTVEEIGGYCVHANAFIVTPAA